MRTIFIFLPALLLAAPAALPAQPCPAPTISLVVRDYAGAAISLSGHDVTYTPDDGPGAAWRFRADRVPSVAIGDADADSLPAVTWVGTRCLVRLDEAVIRRPEGEMRLMPCIAVSSNLHRQRYGLSGLAMEAPPFAPGRWLLRAGRMQRGDGGWLRMGGARWVRHDGEGGCKEAGIAIGRKLDDVTDESDARGLIPITSGPSPGGGRADRLGRP